MHKNFTHSKKVWRSLFGQLPPSSALSCPRILDFPEISEMCPTLRSCISELSEYFLMGPVPLQRSMSKLYNKPNTSENGHLAQKLRSIQNRKFSKNRFHTPTVTAASLFLPSVNSYQIFRFLGFSNSIFTNF